MTELDLLQKLADAYGPSGHEEEVRRLLMEVLKGHVDDMQVDPLGNLLVYKKGRSGSGSKIMWAAHMDEIGVIVVDIDDKGFLRLQPVGGVDPLVLLGQRVRFPGGVVASIGAEPVEDPKEIKFPKLFADIGASSKEQAEKAVGYGTMGVYYASFRERDGIASGKAMDDRSGCAILAQALLEMKEVGNEVVAVFTVQEEVGLRGARTAAFGVDPQVGFAIDVTGTGDTPKAQPMAVALGKGTAIKMKDQSLVTPPFIRDLMVERAEKRGIPYQMEVLSYGGTDAGAIHLSRAGVPSGVVSLPTRYLHTPAEMIALSDLRASIDLVKALSEEPILLPSPV
ncbi:MAG: M42 family metallopeptidase [Bacillota bacterium]|nr:M42 family metallopeptidase [Bacillota bacterium]